jgi:hypothetical protein
MIMLSLWELSLVHILEKSISYSLTGEMLRDVEMHSGLVSMMHLVQMLLHLLRELVIRLYLRRINAPGLILHLVLR